MPTNWTVNFFDFVVFSDTLTETPVFAALSDSLNFADALTQNHHRTSFSDIISLHDTITQVGYSTHHFTFSSTLAFTDTILKGPKAATLSDNMILADAFTYAQHLLHDTLVFTDTCSGEGTYGIYDDLTFSDNYTLNFHWGPTTGMLSGDSLAFADYFFQFQSNPYTPNWPLTTVRSGNPGCL